MPWASKAQRGYMWVHHPEIAREFEKKTVDLAKLPERVKKKPVKPKQDENAKSRA